MSETYVVLIAEDQHGCLKTALVEKDTYEEDPDPSAFFSSGMKGVQHSGEVEISGDVHLLPSYIVEG